MISSFNERGYLIVEYETQQEAKALYMWYEDNFKAFSYTQLKIQAAEPQKKALEGYLATWVKSGDLNIT